MAGALGLYDRRRVRRRFELWSARCDGYDEPNGSWRDGRLRRDHDHDRSEQTCDASDHDARQLYAGQPELRAQ
jgi:hypothetical protein